MFHTPAHKNVSATAGHFEPREESQAPTALEICQKVRNEIREERDAALAAVAKLKAVLALAEDALVDAQQTAAVRLAAREIRKARAM